MRCSSLKFSVQLQHHARHQLPTFQLIFVHVIESLVFVPVMGNILWCFEIFEVCGENVSSALLQDSPNFYITHSLFCFDICRLWLGSSFFYLSSTMINCLHFLFWLLYGYVSYSQWSGNVLCCGISGIFIITPHLLWLVGLLGSKLGFLLSRTVEREIKKNQFRGRES